MSVPAEYLFDRVRPEALEHEDWAVVDDRPGLCLSTRPLSVTMSLLRARYEWPLPIHDAVALMRPEVYWDSRRPEFDDGTQSCKLEVSAAPGDAVVSMQVSASTSAPLLSASQHAIVGHAQSAAERKTRNYLRWVVRRDFPLPGQFTCLTLPMDPETGEFYEERGMVSSCTVVFEAHRSEPGKTALTRVSVIHRAPDWLMSYIANHFLMKHAWISRYKASAVYNEARDGALSYVVVGIKKCSRGPPLLPRSLREDGSMMPTTFDSEWVPANFESNHFPGYLREFLRQLGVHVDVYDTLDGRRLVPYQAVLMRGNWELASAAIEEPWKTHKAAYRRRYGGTSAPYFVENMEPRVLANEAAVEVAVMVGVSAECATPAFEKKDVPMKIKNSFLHFTPPPGLPLLRAASNPELEVLVDDSVEAD